MKPLVVVLLTLLLGTLAHASSKYAGKYYAISRDYNPLNTGPTIVAGVNITVRDDGSLTGKGADIDFRPIILTGEVKDSGEVILIETNDGHRTTETAHFETDGTEFFLALPSGFTVTGEKISSKLPQAGVYHASIEDREDVIFFVHRNGSVNGIFFNADGRIVDVDGEATTEGFSARSDNGATFTARFHGEEISGAFSPEDIEPIALPFSGARY
jgi:hypothetical protein